ITVPGDEGETVLRLLADGTRLPVASSWEDGVLTFSGPSQGTYLLLAAAAADGSGDGSGSGDGPGNGAGGGDGAAGGNADGTGSGDGSGDGDSTGAGSGTGTGAGTGGGDGTGGGSSGGPMARTGAEILVPLGVAVALLLGGGALVALRRRR